MSERVTTARVRELRDAATPGPWEHEHIGYGGQEVTMDARHSVFVDGRGNAALIAAAPDLAADLLEAREELRLTTPAVDAVRGVIAALCLAPDATYTEVVAAVEERAGMLAHAVQSWKARASGMEAAEREVARLRRQMEHATPWQVSEVPTDEEMRALRMRWAFGPEKYQADADSLIAAVIHGREENARLRAIVEGLRERAAAQLRARAACLRSYADSADADDHANDAAHYRAEASEADTCAGIVAATLLSPAPREPAADDVGRDAPGVG